MKYNKTINKNFIKYDKGKLQYNLIPPEVLKELAKVMTYGANKYEKNNWKKCKDLDRYINALYRHLEAYRSGEKIDNESKISHLSHALANVAFILYLELTKGNKK